MRIYSTIAILTLLGSAACSGGGGSNTPPVLLGAAAVSAGGSGTCAVGGAGGLACWGAVPDGTPLDTSAGGADVLGAVTIATPIDLIALSLQRSGDGHNTGCAVGSDHQVYCWGHLVNVNVAVPFGSGITALSGATSAASVAIENTHLCVIRTDNQVRCWGAFYGGGRGTDSVDLSGAGPGFTMTPNGLSPAQAAYGTALGRQWGCAIRTDSLVSCWGTRHRGQLGGAVADSVLDCSAQAPAWCQPGAAVVAGGHKYRSVAAQDDHACAVLIGGGVECWGRKPGTPIPANWTSSCATASDCVTTPTAVTLPGPAIRVTVGADHACALLDTGAAYCWGDNTYGQLGRTGAASATPVAVSGNYIFTTISAGDYHTCGIEAGTGAIGCWGDNGDGQLGDGTTVNKDRPVPVVAAQ